MSGTIVVDRIESDASYASSINIASPIQISNTITGNVNFDSGTLFVDSVGNKIGIGTTTPNYDLNIRRAGQTNLSLYNSSSAVELRLISESNACYVQTNTNHPLWFATNNGAVQMEIDTSGRVTKPYQPASSYRKTGGQTVNAGNTDVVAFATVIRDEATLFNTSTNRFTAPTTGWYQFGANVNFLTNGQSVVNFVLYKNGVAQYFAHSITSPSLRQNLVIAGAIYLTSTDYIDFRFYSGGQATTLDNAGAFSVYLLG